MNISYGFSGFQIYNLFQFSCRRSSHCLQAARPSAFATSSSDFRTGCSDGRKRSAETKTRPAACRKDRRRRSNGRKLVSFYSNISPFSWLVSLPPLTFFPEKRFELGNFLSENILVPKVVIWLSQRKDFILKLWVDRLDSKQFSILSYIFIKLSWF